MAHGLSLATLVSAQNQFRSVFSDMMIVCVYSAKPGPAQTSWAPNKATFMSMGGLKSAKKLFKIWKFSENQYFDKTPKEILGTINFRPPLAVHY